MQGTYELILDRRGLEIHGPEDAAICKAFEAKVLPLMEKLETGKTMLIIHIADDGREERLWRQHGERGNNDTLLLDVHDFTPSASNTEKAAFHRVRGKPSVAV